MARHAPSDDDMRYDHMHDGANPVARARIWDDWLTAHDYRVRRDAAREALDGLAEEAMGAFKSPQPPTYPRSWAEMAGVVEWFRDTHYPEQEDQP